jgi:hypothetical protein
MGDALPATTATTAIIDKALIRNLRDVWFSSRMTAEPRSGVATAISLTSIFIR